MVQFTAAKRGGLTRAEAPPPQVAPPPLSAPMSVFGRTPFMQQTQVSWAEFLSGTAQPMHTAMAQTTAPSVRLSPTIDVRISDNTYLDGLWEDYAS